MHTVAVRCRIRSKGLLEAAKIHLGLRDVVMDDAYDAVGPLRMLLDTLTPKGSEYNCLNWTKVQDIKSEGDGWLVKFTSVPTFTTLTRLARFATA